MYVLVHGAYQGGWVWKHVAKGLRAAGHLVYAPTLDGCAERRDQSRAGVNVGTLAREVAQLLFYEDLHDVVLLGTSSTGEVIELSTVPSRQDAEGRMFASLEPATRAWTLARYTPHPIAALEAPMEPTAFWARSWTAAVIRCKQARNPPEAHQRRTGKRLKASYTKMDIGQHPVLSQPNKLVRPLTWGPPRTCRLTRGLGRAGHAARACTSTSSPQSRLQSASFAA